MTSRSLLFVALVLGIVPFTSLLVACAGASGEGSGGSGRGGVPNTPEGGAAGDISTGDPGGGDGAAPAPTLVVLTNLKLAGFPHPIDVYAPTNAKRAFVFLHGGGGSKEGALTNEIGIASDSPGGGAPVLDETWLIAHETTFVLPQGQAVPGAPKAPTWSNLVMTSGEDDVAFLTALSAALRDGTLAASVPKAAHVHLAGHSNGGMMANRMWCEQPLAFDAYGAISGPASTALTKAACQPRAAKPFLAVIGDQDTIVQSKGAWAKPTWSINSCLQSGSGDAFVDPELQNDLSFFEEIRVPAACDIPAAAPVTSSDGARTSWTACDGKLRLERINGADHCVVIGLMPCRNNQPLGGGSCSNALEPVSGLRMRDLFTSFFVDNE
jgi:poly(3-hydroxybutyrate) depolymerase